MSDQHLRQIVLQTLCKVAASAKPELAVRWRELNNIAMADLGLDSLEGMEWCMEIEAATGVEVDPAELATTFFGSALLCFSRSRISC